MTSRTLKLLTASSAFIAAASAGHAEIISGTSTTGYTNLDGANYVSGSALISTTTPGITISGTGIGNVGNAILATSATSTIRSTDSVAAILLGANANISGTLTINNSGTIVNTGTGGAINTAGTQIGGQPVVVINNTGTISGTVTNGTGKFTYNATNAVQNGGLTSTGTGTTTSADSVSLVNSTLRGNIDLGNGTNNITVSNSTVTGNYVGGSGIDSLTVKGGSTYIGNIGLAAGTDDLAVNGSRVNGNVSAAAGAAATMTLTNAVVSGTIDLGGTGDGDTLTINGSDTFTTLGTISNVETVDLNTNTVLNHSMSGVNTLTVASGKTLTTSGTATFGTAALVNSGTINVNADTNMTGQLTNNGLINIASGKTLTADTLANTGGKSFGIAVSDSTHAGKLGFLTTGAYATSLTINMGANAGFITSGTRIAIISGTSSAATLTNANTGVYRLSTVNSNNSTSLVVGRVATNSVVSGANNKAVATAIDTATANNNAGIVKIHSAIGQQTTAAGVENVIESLTPSIDGAGMASVNVTVDTGNQISNRLASVRSTSGVATGDPMASKHMWVQGFGSTVKQDDNDGAAGYDASAGGMSIGMDTDTMIDGFTTGVAFSYGRGKVDSNASSNASTDIDTYVGTLYGSRVLDNGVFVNGQVGVGYNKYDMERTILGVGQATGDTNGLQGTVKAEAGKDFAAGGFTVTPLASLQYTYLDMDSYTESGAGGASLRVDPESLSTVDAGAGGQVAYAIPLNDGGTLKPSVHAKYVYRFGDTDLGTTSSFSGGGASFNTTGVKADRSSVNLGAGMLLTTVGGTDLSLNYDADIRSNLTGHTGQLKARWAF